MSTTKKETTKDSKPSNLKEFEERAKELFDYCGKNNITIAMSAGFAEGDSLHCTMALGGKSELLGELLHKLIDENIEIKKAIALAMLKSKLKDQ